MASVALTSKIPTRVEIQPPLESSFDGPYKFTSNHPTHSNENFESQVEEARYFYANIKDDKGQRGVSIEELVDTYGSQVTDAALKKQTKIEKVQGIYKTKMSDGSDLVSTHDLRTLFGNETIDTAIAEMDYFDLRPSHKSKREISDSLIEEIQSAYRAKDDTGNYGFSVEELRKNYGDLAFKTAYTQLGVSERRSNNRRKSTLTSEERDQLVNAYANQRDQSVSSIVKEFSEKYGKSVSMQTLYDIIDEAGVARRGRKTSAQVQPQEETIPTAEPDSQEQPILKLVGEYNLNTTNEEEAYTLTSTLPEISEEDLLSPSANDLDTLEFLETIAATKRIQPEEVEVSAEPQNPTTLEDLITNNTNILPDRLARLSTAAEIQTLAQKNQTVTPEYEIEDAEDAALLPHPSPQLPSEEVLNALLKPLRDKNPELKLVGGADEAEVGVGISEADLVLDESTTQLPSPYNSQYNSSNKTEETPSAEDFAAFLEENGATAEVMGVSSKSKPTTPTLENRVASSAPKKLAPRSLGFGYIPENTEPGLVGTIEKYIGSAADALMNGIKGFFNREDPNAPPIQEGPMDIATLERIYGPPTLKWTSQEGMPSVRPAEPEGERTLTSADQGVYGAVTWGLRPPKENSPAKEKFMKAVQIGAASLVIPALLGMTYLGITHLAPNAPRELPKQTLNSSAPTQEDEPKTSTSGATLRNDRTFTTHIDEHSAGWVVPVIEEGKHREDSPNWKY